MGAAHSPRPLAGSRVIRVGFGSCAGTVASDVNDGRTLDVLDAEIVQ